MTHSDAQPLITRRQAVSQPAIQAGYTRSGRQTEQTNQAESQSASDAASQCSQLAASTDTQSQTETETEPDADAERQREATQTRAEQPDRIRYPNEFPMFHRIS